jgi:hypothetical protein
VKRSPKPPMPPDEVAAARAFHDAALRHKACVVCGRTDREARRGAPAAVGPTAISTVTHLQAHHALSRQRLRRNGLEHLFWDPRNAVPACEDPCHRWHTTAKARIQLAALPPEALEFAEEVGLLHALEREYA